MKRQRLVKWLGFVILILLCLYYLLPFAVTSPARSPGRTPEEILAFRVLDGQPVPPQVTKIEAIEGPIAFGYSNGSAFVRFEATASFITELVEKDYGFYGAYAAVPCGNNFLKDDLLQGFFNTPLKWWKPSEVASPVCYTPSTCILYDEKYLLIDPDNNVGYFYRPTICGLCPSGEQGHALRESPRCKEQ